MDGLLVAFLILFCGQAVVSTSQESAKYRLNDSSNIRVLDSVVERLMECRRIPGLVISVVDRDSSLLRREYGYANIGRSQPMTEHTRLCVASLTKSFSSALLGKLLNGTGVTWDTPVSKILPYVRFPDDYVTEHVTVRDILSHRTGIESSFDELWFFDVHNQTELYRRIQLMPYGNTFRSAAHYNNIVYSLSGPIAEVIAGQQGQQRRRSWEDLLATHILRPLGMTNTSFYHRRTNDAEMFATPYGHVRDAEGLQSRLTELNVDMERGVQAIASSIALCTTSSDIALWMKCLLSALADDGCETVSREIASSVTTAQVLANGMFHSRIQRPHTSVSMDVNGYGLGWFTGSYRDRRFLMHFGSIPGSYTMQVLVPETDLGVFISYNGALQTDPYTINSVIFTYILDLVLNKTSWITSPEAACGFLDRIHDLSPPVPQPNSSLRTNFTAHHAVPYVGIFRHPLLGDVRVRYEESRLVMGYGCFEGELAGETDGSSSGWGANFLVLPRDETWLVMLSSVEVIFSSRASSSSNRSVFTRLALPFLEQNMEFSRIENDLDHNRKHLSGVDKKASPFQCSSDCVTPLGCRQGVTVLISALVCVVTSLDFFS